MRHHIGNSSIVQDGRILHKSASAFTAALSMDISNKESNKNSSIFLLANGRPLEYHGRRAVTISCAKNAWSDQNIESYRKQQACHIVVPAEGDSHEHGS